MTDEQNEQNTTEDQVVDGDGNGIDEQPNNDGQANTTGHPAWNELLEALPEDLHGVVTPHLDKWDKGVQEKVQSLHSKYKPYDDLVENNVDPNAVKQALTLAQRVENDPQAVYNALAEAYGFNNEDSNDEPDDSGNNSTEDDPDDPYAKRIAALEGMLENFTQSFQQREAQQQQEQEQKAFEDYLGNLRQEHGDYNEEFVVAQMANGMDGDKAVKLWNETVQNAAQKLNTPGTSAPRVAGSSGGAGVPSSQTNPGNMNDQDVNDLVVQYLKASNQE